MSSAQFDDGTMFNAEDPFQARVEAQQTPSPPQPLDPIPVAAEVADFAPAAPAEPVTAPGSPMPEAPSAMAVADMRDVPLGALLSRAGLLPEERLEEALQEGMKIGKRLGEILLERGWVSDVDLGRLLAGQKGLPFVELDPSAIDPTAPPLLHSETARVHGALPIGFQGGVPIVAVADPSDDLVIENVRRALACEPVLVVAGRDALLRAINEAYGAVAVEPQVVAPQSVEPTPVVERAPGQPEPVAEPLDPVPAVPPAYSVEPQPAEPFEHEVPVTPEPEPFVHVEPQPAERAGVSLAPEPEPTPEPAAQVVEAEPVPTAPVVPEPQPAVQAQQEPEPTVVPEPPAAPELTWSVVVRLTDGERLKVGTFPGRGEAFEGARKVVGQIGTDGTWPFLDGRFIRPESIVSVDLVELEVAHYLGSARGAGFSPA